MVNTQSWYPAVLLLLDCLSIKRQSRYAEMEMSASFAVAAVDDGLPRIMKFCNRCHRETPHQINRGEGVSAVICVPCWHRAVAYELERD